MVSKGYTTPQKENPAAPPAKNVADSDACNGANARTGCKPGRTGGTHRGYTIYTSLPGLASALLVVYIALSGETL